MKFLLYDTETTALDTKKCGLHQLSGLIIEYEDLEFKILDKFDYRIQPFKGKSVVQSALDIGNLTLDILRSYPPPSRVFKQFTDLLGKHVDKFDTNDKLIQVGYNINFDKEVLRQWFTDCGDDYFGSWFFPNPIDVMSDATRVLAEVRPYMRNFKLGSVAEMLGCKVPFDKLHDSLEDVYLTFEVMKKCWCHPVPIPLDDFDIKIIEKQIDEKIADKNNPVRKNNTEGKF